MLLLAIDTSSPAVTAAVHDGSSVVGSATELGARAHGELLGLLVERALAEAGARPAALTSIAVGIGPGPFTGLRVGIVTGKVMALALGIEVHGVCSLDALAWLAHHAGAVDTAFSVATDARRREVYVARYDSDAVRLEGPQVIAPGDLPEELRRSPVVGHGAALYPQWFSDPRGPDHVSGAAVAAYAAGILHAGFELCDPDPMYLRRPDATPAVGRKPVLR